MTIFEGSFENGIANNVGMMLYPNGEAYYGQHTQFERNGLGKQIFLDGSYYEGSWENDKMEGEKCKYYQSGANTIYLGPFESNRKSGLGIMLHMDSQEIYEGEFSNDKKNGVGLVYHKDGKVYQCSYKQGNIDGGLQFFRIMNKVETNMKFRDAKKGHFYYVK